MSTHGRVVERHRGHTGVELAGGLRIRCRAPKRSLQPLVGDEVECEPGVGMGGGTITEVAPRLSVLCRTDARGRRELLAANLTRLVAVAAPSPAPDWTVVDHYLVAAELAGLSAAVVFNKSDLAAQPPEQLECYRRAGYAVHRTSTRSGAGLAELAAGLEHERSVMVGQSGVGKSSLLNALLGDAVQKVGELTGKGAHGRHTTSGAVLHRLAGGGELIDSPGVRNFTPYIEHAGDLQHGFREFAPLLGRCRFDNCLHLTEPGCAVKAAVADGGICLSRHASYERLHALVRELETRRRR